MSVKAMCLAWKIDLPMAEKFILIALADNANDQFNCYPSLSTIAEKCGMSRRAVINNIDKLERKKIVIKEKRDYKSNYYTLNLGGELNALVNQMHHQGSEPDAPPSEPDALAVVNEVHRNRQLNRKGTNNTPCGIKKYLENCKENKIKPIPENDAVFAIAEKSKIPLLKPTFRL